MVGSQAKELLATRDSKCLDVVVSVLEIVLEIVLIVVQLALILLSR